AQRQRRRTRGKRNGEYSADGDREHSTHPFPPRSRESAMPLPRRRFPWRAPRLHRVARGERRWYAFASHASARIAARRAADAAGPAVGAASGGGSRRTRRVARAIRRTPAPPPRGGGGGEPGTG